MTVMETASVLEPQETLVSVSHAHPFSVLQDPETGQRIVNTSAFLQLDARVRRGLSEKLEVQGTMTGLLDQRVGVARGGIKYQLDSPYKNARFALAGGAGLGWNAARAVGDATSQNGIGGLDLAAIVSTPRHWKASAYGALGANLSGSALLLGTDAEGNKEDRPEALFTPYGTIGVDFATRNTHLLIETTTYLVVNDKGAAANFLGSVGISFGVGKKRYVPGRRTLPEGVSVCEDGQVLVSGQCFNLCPPKLSTCPSPYACVIVGGQMSCEVPEAYGKTVKPESAPSSQSSSLPSSAPLSSSETQPSSQPLVEPTSQPNPAPLP
jgi:hypothetical protein